ncbi:MAG TPA: acyltransferase, partial [Bacteroidia bacterium]|nr:acyltransferase [Bacteroidia bacterium]
YFLRRFKRIYPPYWVFLALSALLVMVLYQPWPYLLTETHYPIPHPASLSLSQCIGNITLTETWRYHFFGEQTKFLIDSAWTLCYEEQFYAICGLILFLAPRQLFQITFWISIIVFFVRYFSSTLNIPVFGFFFDGRWLSFALGIMLYYKINYAYKEQTKWINAFLILSTVYQSFF